MKQQIQRWLGSLCKRLVGAERAKTRTVRDGSSPCCETLEDRTFLTASPYVTNALADDRGQSIFTFSTGLNLRTLSTRTIKMYTAGADGKFGSSDDVRIGVTYSYSRGTLTVTGKVAANTPYRVILISGGIRGENGAALNGSNARRIPGGNYDIVVRNETKLARFTTNLGVMNVQLSTTAAQNVVANFISYADEGDWDGTFFHRSEKTPPSTNLNVIQGGGFKVVSSTAIDSVVEHTKITDQIGLLNTRGTIGLATAADQTTGVHYGSNQWYFNTQTNTGLDGSYSVFGAVTDAPSLAVMDKIAAVPTQNRNPSTNPGGPFGQIPVMHVSVGQDMNAEKDLVVVTRLAMMSAVVPTAQSGLLAT